MSNLDLTTQDASEKLEDSEETWALKLMNECEQAMLIPILDTPYIYVEPIEQLSQPASIESVQFKHFQYTTAIERQISLKAEQAMSAASNTDKVAQRFWSLFRKKVHN
jgi:hypothetical protein